MIKVIRSSDYNYTFNLEDGTFCRWGKNKEDDPIMAPAPEILDIEISAGKCSGNCKFCYKSNSSKAENVWMNFETYQRVFEKLTASNILTQIAFGITDVSSNPDLWKIMEYSRKNNVIPNITVNGKNITDEEITRLANVCGAVAVSHYNDNECYGTIQRLAEAKKVPGATLKQINIHMLYCQERLEECYKIIKDAKTDERLKDLNAIVFLSLKPKGDRNTFHSVPSLETFKNLFKTALDNNVGVGFDSCGAPMAAKSAEQMGRKDIFSSIESCCGCLFSSYVDVKGDYFPCSFAAGEGDWKEGLSVLEATDFVKDIWHHPRVEAWREKALSMTKGCSCSFASQCRPCPLFDITPCFKKV